jgi:hypothetical protein
MITFKNIGYNDHLSYSSTMSTFSSWPIKEDITQQHIMGFLIGQSNNYYPFWLQS